MSANQRFFCDFRVSAAAVASPKNRTNQKTCVGAVGVGRSANGNTEEGLVVEIVSIDVAEPEPGVTLGSENKQEVRDGKFEHESVTGLVNAPNFWLTEIE